MTKILMPGDELATSEEYIPGEGTYERQGIIYAAVMGQKNFDEKEKIARVKASTSINTLGPGNIILGEVNSVSNSVARVTISGLEGSDKNIGNGLVGVIHVSKTREEYSNDARNDYRIGDLVRARVEQIEPSIQLVTNAEEFGVLKARCMKCRDILFNKDGTLFCPACERNETRKMAGDFHRYTPYHQD